MNLTLDLQTVVGSPPRKSPRILRAGDGQPEGARHGHTRSVHSQPKQHGVTKKKLRPCSIFTNNTSVYYSCIANDLGVDASFINRVANGEHSNLKG